MEKHFSAYMYRLRYIERWSLMRNVMPENVAEHSFHVALLTHMLCTIGNIEFGRHVDTNHAITLALFHDATEVFTGDIPTPVKHHNPRILANFREIESIASERLVSMVPPSLLAAYSPLLDSKSSEHPELHKYVKAADLLDAYLKCVTELTAGNREFAEAKKQTIAKLQAFDMPEVEYFLQYLAPSFEKTLDELSETE
ncbi:5'-deoxynucleotidase [Paenibacillus selenitireducens]|uniref:5'-deoxynucleotidase n=1 Tax=Paenibacillus selenitireducens TaxID=1324314 RepID=A0A1T2XM51_9BACL|nr:5'-deoxynucleotidase [Paenibacillus selenitireducens]OPA80898.1 5'-deoxynucleotidase [Paenibacillus selenitireducens]